MAALANVLLSSIASSTVRTSSATVGYDTTFAPEGWKPGNVASWVDRSGGIPLGYKRLTFGLRPPTKESRIYKISTKFYNPVLETIDPAVGIFGPKLAYELQAHMDFLIPERATQAECAAFLCYLRTLFCGVINASDDVPTDNTGSPLTTAIYSLEDVY